MNPNPPASADLSALAPCADELAQAFVNLSSDIALVIGDDGVVQRVAQHPSTPMSREAESWVGRPWAETVTGDTRQKIEAMLADVWRTGQARKREVNLAAPDGANLPVAYTALRLGPRGPVLAVGRDLRAVSAIQQRFVEVQADLERGYWHARQVQSHHQLLVQVATEGVLTVDASTLAVVQANRAAQVVFQQPVAFLAGKELPRLFAPGSASAVRELLVRSAHSGQPAEIIGRIGAQQSPAAVSATPFRSDGRMRLIVRVRPTRSPDSDATRANQVMARLVDNIRESVVITDSSGRVMVANPAFVKLLQAADENAVRGHLLTQWLGRVASDVPSLLAGAQQHGIAHLQRSSLRPPSGMARDVDVCAVMLTEGDQQCFGLTIEVRDERVARGAETTLGTLIAGLQSLELRLGAASMDELMMAAQPLVQVHLMQAALRHCQGDPEQAARLLKLAPEQWSALASRVPVALPEASR